MEMTGEGACVLSPFVLVATIVLIKPPSDSHHRMTEIAIYESTKRSNEQRANCQTCLVLSMHMRLIFVSPLYGNTKPATATQKNSNF